MSTKKLTDVVESADAAPVAEQVAVESLVEDVSIDGMCGVY